MIFESIIVLILLTVIIGLVYQFMYSIFIWALVGGIVFFLLFVGVELIVHIRRKKKAKAMTSSEDKPKEEKKEESSDKEEKKEESSDKEEKKKPLKFEEIQEEFSSSAQDDQDVKKLKGFIEKNLKKGFKPKIVREALIKQGWPQDQVDKAFNP